MRRKYSLGNFSNKLLKVTYYIAPIKQRTIRVPEREIALPNPSQSP